VLYTILALYYRVRWYGHLNYKTAERLQVPLFQIWRGHVITTIAVPELSILGVVNFSYHLFFFFYLALGCC
jgi:hypothetical protein